MLMPEDYINGLRTLNISRTGAAGVIGTPVKVEDPAQLRAQALKSIDVQQKHGAKVLRASKSDATEHPTDGHNTTTPGSSKKSETKQGKSISVRAELNRQNLVPTNN